MSEQGSEAHFLALHRWVGGGGGTADALQAGGAGGKAPSPTHCHAPPPPGQTCRAAFEGDVDEIGHLLPCLSLRQKIQLDPQGNTVGGWVGGGPSWLANLSP